MNKDELEKKLKKFIQDPDWGYVEDLLLSYVSDMANLVTVDPRSEMSNDQIASEVRGRKLLAARLGQFLNETRLIRDEKIEQIIKPPSFK